MHGLLVIAQMAGSTIVLVCGSLCLYSVLQVKWMDPGFDAARVWPYPSMTAGSRPPRDNSSRICNRASRKCLTSSR